MSALHTASIREAWDETTNLRGLKLALPSLVEATYRAPGQYLKVRAGDKEGWFALASAPGEPVEILVKRGAAVGDALSLLTAGGSVETSEAQGRGYPVVESVGRELILVAAGSGITPIRAVINHVAAARERFGRVMLFYGHRHTDEFAYLAEEQRWRDAGIEIVRVVSQPGTSAWGGAVGHVQEAITAARPTTENAVAFLCGMKPMVAGVTEALVGLGLPKDHIHLNY